MNTASFDDDDGCPNDDTLAELRGLVKDLTTCLEKRNKRIAELEAEMDRMRAYYDEPADPRPGDIL
jgi:hypothetical protein